MKKRLSSHGLRNLLVLVKPHRGLFTLGMVALAGGSGINLLFPEVVRRLLNSDAHSLLVTNSWMTALSLVALFAVQGVCFYFRSLIFGVIGQKVVASLRKDLYSSLLSQEVGFHDQRRTGDLVSRVASDTQMIQDAVSLRLSVLIRYSLQVIVGICLMGLISVTLTIALVLVLPVLIGFSILLGKRLRQYSKLVQEKLGEASTITEETLSEIRVVKAFGNEQYEKERFNRAVDSVLNLGLQRASLSAFFSSFVSFLMNVSIVAVLFLGIGLVAKSSTLSYGDLTAFVLYGIIVAVSFAFISGAYGELLQGLGATDRVFEIIGRQSKISIGQVGNFPSPFTGGLKFHDVSFAYPSRDDLPVLNNISFSVVAGQTTAIVGPSGSGKSTIMNLILRFYDPTTGSIELDGLDLRQIDGVKLRESIGFVPQEPALFAVSIAENLRYGNHNATHEELVEAARKSNILEFINGLPDGFNTLCGDRGIHLSSGQRQRIAIARAFLKNPQLLLLDEATSALDSENEVLVQEALSALMKERTALIIAHRFTNLLPRKSYSRQSRLNQ